MAKNDSRKLFDAQMSMEDVKKDLEKKCSTVKQKGRKSFEATFDERIFVVEKRKDGYFAGNSFPGYTFFIIWAIVSVVFLFMKGFSAGEMDYIIAIIGASFGSALVPSVILYWVIALIHDSRKRKDLDNFCQEMKREQIDA
jgi:hypothetical protein